MSNTSFEFKEFAICQDKCAMKVGTDGVLLGAWCQLENQSEQFHVLDIGTGTGLIALMCAQRWKGARIDAIEIDPDAARQAVENVQRSPWCDRIQVIPLSLAEWRASQPASSYELIVSNPPFYNATLLPEDAGRSMARHTHSLPWTELMQTAKERLTTDGRLCLIFPTSEWDKVATAAIVQGLSPVHITDVVTKVGKTPKRTMASFAAKACVPLRDTLVIRNEDGTYNEKYLSLVFPFYKTIH